MDRATGQTILGAVSFVPVWDFGYEVYAEVSQLNGPGGMARRALGERTLADVSRDCLGHNGRAVCESERKLRGLKAPSKPTEPADQASRD